MQPHKKEFQQIMRKIGGGRYHLFDVFRDFCFMGAAAFSQPLDFRQDREEEYLRLAGKYSREDLERLSRALALVVMGLEAEVTDFLGESFMEMELGNNATGQYYTPWPVAEMMAMMTFSPAEVEEKGFVTLQEPCIGSGCLVMAFAQAMRREGLNPQRQLQVVGTDIDHRAAHMAFIQLTLLHIPAVIQVGNSLSLQVSDTWRTPAFMMHPFRIQPEAREKELCAPPPARPERPLPPPAKPAGRTQLRLF